MKPGTAPINIILLGDVASGKATQSKFLVDKFKLIDIDVGELLTKERKHDKKLDAICKKSADTGQLVPSLIVQELLKKAILKAPIKQGLLFDGTPKMLAEAWLVKSLLHKTKRTKPLVVYLKLPKAEILKRIKLRKGYEAGHQRRADDNPVALENRLIYYRQNVSKVLEYFSKHYGVSYISGLGTRAIVRQRLSALTKGFIK